MTGANLWVSRYDGGIRKKDMRARQVCNEGKVFATGSSDQGAGRKLDYATVKIDAGAGTTDWVGRYNGAIGSHDIAYNVAYDRTTAAWFLPAQVRALHHWTSRRYRVHRRPGPGTSRDAGDRG